MKTILFENKYCQLIESNNYYILKSKKGIYNDLYFTDINKACQAVAIIPGKFTRYQFSK